jgi:hypothetical protein
MAGGGQFLQYDIFKPGGTPWGATGGNRSANSAPANGISALSVQRAGLFRSIDARRRRLQ